MIIDLAEAGKDLPIVPGVKDVSVSRAILVPPSSFGCLGVQTLVFVVNLLLW
jgi:hypothetical protein